MATERQIAANRRNARKSTGPKTKAGKTRSSGNSYRHGMTSRVAANEEGMQEVERLASKIAEGSQNPLVIENARTAAEAILELGRVRRTRAAIIEHTSEFPDLQLQTTTQTRVPSKQWRRRAARQRVASNHSPSEALDRIAESVQRLLPDLRTLDRYERRAASRRDRAIAAVASNGGKWV